MWRPRLLEKHVKVIEILEEYRWKKRILVLQTEDPDKVKAQKELLDRVIPDLRERKLVLLGFAIDKEPYASIDITQLKTKYKNKQHSILLFGLDGQLKNSWTIPVDPEKIFTVIDKMPMRRRELKEKEN